ncbi:hypothetical protein [Streptomyces sp. NPDC001068]|uniref:hypothetical protein n=1 Tax=Streptomyces sp. NPDC001068 TaxID=3364544 RepID=UPI0036BF8254
MSWTRGLPGALAVCVLLPVAAAGCGSGAAHGERGTGSPSPVGRILDDTDEDGRHYREAGGKQAPEVDTVITPDAAGGWDVRLDVHRFRFSRAGTAARAVAGRGLAYLFVDDGLVTRLRTPGYHLPAGLVPHGTHRVTARLYADDGTVWAVRGEPVESTADITASGAERATPTAAAAHRPDECMGHPSPYLGARFT